MNETANNLLFLLLFAFSIGSLIGVVALTVQWSVKHAVDAFFDARSFAGYVRFRCKWRRNVYANALLRDLRNAEKYVNSSGTPVAMDRLRHYQRLTDDYLAIEDEK